MVREGFFAAGIAAAGGNARSKKDASRRRRRGIRHLSSYCERAVRVVTQILPAGSPWRGSLRDLPHMINTIRRSKAFGRLTLRSTTHIGLAHLYFRGGTLTHIVSTIGDAGATLADLQYWTQAIVRFERSITTSMQNVSSEHERMLDDLLSQLQRRNAPLTSERPGMRLPMEPPRVASIPKRPRMAPITEPPPAVSTSETPRIVDSNIVDASGVEQLITPMEWRMLVEGIRRISLAVAQLVGPQEAINVLRDILEDFSSAFPALSSLQIAPGGYLQVVRTAQLDRIPRMEVIKGFAALIATCRLFCSPLIGEESARKLIFQALNGIGPALAELGVFNV